MEFAGSCREAALLSDGQEHLQLIESGIGFAHLSIFSIEGIDIISIFPAGHPSYLKRENSRRRCFGERKEEVDVQHTAHHVEPAWLRLYLDQGRRRAGR